jgi:SAM-dependent methyltransferase
MSFDTKNVEETYVKNVYQEIAYHFSNTRVYKWSWIIDFLDTLNTNSLVYDLGCGNGRNMNHGGLKFIGVDNCQNFIQICNQKNLKVINSNIIKIPLANDSADAIICIAVFHHLYSNQNRIDALFEMKRLIKKNGKILLSVWSINQPKKTGRVFNNYGNNIVLWNNNNGKIFERFYYIFKLDELKKIIDSVELIIVNYEYNCGNEIFTLMKL